MEGEVLYEEKSYRLLLPMVFRIYNNKILITFWPFRYEIPFSEIEDIKIVDKIPFWIGWGLRVNLFTRTLYFVYHHGKGVEIRKKSGFWRRIILSVKNPEEFLEILKRQIKSNM